MPIYYGSVPFALKRGSQALNLYYGSTLISGGGGLTPTKSYDFTASLPTGVSFSRAGARTAIVNGVLTSVSSGTPAFESWGDINRGLSIEGSGTNLLTYSNDLSNAAYGMANVTMTAGGDDPLGGTAGWVGTETVANAYHRFTRTINSITSGSNRCFSAFVKKPISGSRIAVVVRLANQFDNEGAKTFFRIDGVDGSYQVEASATLTGQKSGLVKLSNDMYLLWMSGTFATTGNKTFSVDIVDYTIAAQNSYAGSLSESVHLYGWQVTAGDRPFSYIATVAATASNVAETLSVTDLTWFNASQGTFVVEHDLSSGTLLGTGATAVVSASVSGKTAFAWDAVGSDLVNNGGGATGGASPSWSDLRLLGTSGGSSVGRIQSLTYYDQRLSVAQMQTLTSPFVSSNASPGSLRTVAIQNRVPNNLQALSGSVLSFYSRYKMTLGNHDVASIKLDFANFAMPGVAAGNSVVIDEVAFERETGTVEFAPVTFSAGRSVTMASGDKHVMSDQLLPASFTGITVFPANSVWYVRVKGHVAAPGNYCGSQWNVAGQCSAYNTALTTVSAVDATGVFTTSGTAPTAVTFGFCPLVVGVFSAGDPKTFFSIGDSLLEGTGSLNSTGTYIQKSCAINQDPLIQYVKGGSSQYAVRSVAVDWKSYLQYARVLIDGMGTNDGSRLLPFFDYWHVARNTYNYDKIISVGLCPYASSTDSFATEANQTALRTYPGAVENFATSAVSLGYADQQIIPQSVRGVTLSKWKAPGPYTTDGTHQSVLADDAMRDELYPLLAAVTVT